MSRILTGDHCEICGWESWECDCDPKGAHPHTCKEHCFRCGKSAPRGRTCRPIIGLDGELRPIYGPVGA